jgi:hypothetical protein
MTGFSGTSAYIVLSFSKTFDSLFRFLQSRLIDTDIAQDVRKTIIFSMTSLTPKHEQLSPYILPIVYGSGCSVANISHNRVDTNNQHLMSALAISMATGSSYVSSAGGHGIVQVHGTSAVA